MLEPMGDIQQHIDEWKDIKAQLASANRLMSFQAEWGATISRITDEKYGLAYIPVGYGAELRVLNLEGDEPIKVETFTEEPLIDEVFSTIYGECNCSPDVTCKTCRAAAEAVYGDEIFEPYEVVGFEFPADEETVKRVVAKYV